jgi:phage terminase Nu1 subunit (DNA packaging protein)
METLELEDIALLLGVSGRMVRNYIKNNNLTCVGDGRGRRFIWSDVREWYVSYRIERDGSRGNEGCQIPEDDTENMEEASLRKLKAEADLKELELATKRGEVVAIEDVKRSVENVAASLKSAILAMPSKLATRLVGIKDKRAVNDVLTGEAEELCRKLQHVGRRPVEDDEEGDGE